MGKKAAVTYTRNIFFTVTFNHKVYIHEKAQLRKTVAGFACPLLA